MKNTIILILFILFCLVVSYFIAWIGAWILSVLFVYSFNATWPNVWFLGLLVWLAAGTVIAIKNHLSK